MSPSDLGALVREARERRGWTQTDLGTRIGASRFWVAEFERGKAGAELGLALRAVAAVGVRLKADRPVVTAGVRAAGVGGGAGADETRFPPSGVPAHPAASPSRAHRVRTVTRVDAPEPTGEKAVALDDIVGSTPGLVVYGASPAAPSRSKAIGARHPTPSKAGVATSSKTKTPRETAATRPGRAPDGRATVRRTPRSE